MSAYSYFAEFYDILTGNVEYDKRADYIMELFRRHDHEPGLTLDLACGTGSLTLELSRRGVDIFGADSSADMLSVAQQKFDEAGKSTLFLCQKMQALELYGKIDTCICTLDSINHLPSKKAVTAAFGRIANYLQDDGLFVFDCNTVYKHRHVLGDNCFVYDTEKVFCCWQNNYFEKDNRVAITLDFFVPDGKLYRRFSEQFLERAYTREEMNEMLDNAGLFAEAVYDDRSFDPPKPDSQREIFIVRKK